MLDKDEWGLQGAAKNQFSIVHIPHKRFLTGKCNFGHLVTYSYLE